MTFRWVLITVVAMVATALPCGPGTAIAQTTPDSQDRYKHARCVLVADLRAASELVSLAAEVRRLRELGAPEIVVIVAGTGDWDGLSDEAADAARRLKADAVEVRPEWRNSGESPAWLRKLGTAVPSALLEAAYWQDRGYGLLPYRAPGQSLSAQPYDRSPESADDSTKRKLRFSW